MARVVRIALSIRNKVAISTAEAVLRTVVDPYQESSTFKGDTCRSIKLLQPDPWTRPTSRIDRSLQRGSTSCPAATTWHPTRHSRSSRPAAMRWTPPAKRVCKDGHRVQHQRTLVPTADQRLCQGLKPSAVIALLKPWRLAHYSAHGSSVRSDQYSRAVATVHSAPLLIVAS